MKIYNFVPPKKAHMKPIQIAVLDDYQQAAFQFADWNTIREQADVIV